MHLHDPIYALEQNEDLETETRNLIWMPNFLKHHQNLPGPVLFGVGARHLIGERGLLVSLAQAGFKIKHFQPDGKFKEYTYWTPELASATHRATLLYQYVKDTDVVQIIHDYAEEPRSALPMP